MIENGALLVREGMISAGRPNHRVSKEWRSFVKQTEHPVTSLP